MWILLRIKLNSCFKTINVKTKAQCSTADTNVHHMTALPCAQAAGRAPGRVPPGSRSPGDGTARALVSSQNDGGRTLLMNLSWAVNRSVDLDLIVRRWTLGSDFGLQCTGDAYLSQTHGKHFPFINYATHSWTRSSLNWATNKTNSSALSREFTTRFFAEMTPWIWSLWPSKAAQQDAVHRTCFITVSGI